MGKQPLHGRRVVQHLLTDLLANASGFAGQEVARWRANNPGRAADLDRRTEGKKMVDEWLEKAENAKEEFETRVKELSTKVGITEKDDEAELSELRGKVADLEAKLGKPIVHPKKEKNVTSASAAV